MTDNVQIMDTNNIETLKVLIIEDDSGHRRLTEKALNNHPDCVNYQIGAACNLEDALQQIQNNTFDCLILDLSLPDCKAQSTVREIRKISQDIPIVVLSGYTDDDTGLEAIKNGADYYIVKDSHISETLPKAVRFTIQLRKNYYSQIETLKNQLIDARAQQRKANSESRAKGHFLADLSHELRSPMNTIIGFAEILEEEIKRPEHSDYMRLIKSSAENMLLLINDILDLSKIESNRINIDLQKMDIKKLIDELRALTEPQTKKKNINLSVCYHGIVPDIIMSDPVRLRQCLTNLLSNAVKFTEKGFIRIDVASENTTSNKCIHISVADSGIGIEENRLNDIFSPFIQAQKNTEKDYGGTGLGLTITKKLVSMLGGKITCQSTPKQGSKFTITLPVENTSLNSDCETDQNIVVSEIIAGKAKFKGRILTVLDHPVNNLVISMLLNKAGLQVHNLQKPKLAFDEIVQNNYNIVIIDLQLPGRVAYETISKLRDLGNETLIIGLTSENENCRKEDLDKIFCNEYLSKPVSRKKLFETLSNYLNIEKTQQKCDIKRREQTKKVTPKTNLSRAIDDFLHKLPRITDSIINSLDEEDKVMLDELSAMLKEQSRNQAIETSDQNIDNNPIDSNTAKKHITLVKDVVDELITICNKIAVKTENAYDS